MNSQGFKKHIVYQETEDKITRAVKWSFKKSNNKTLERSMNKEPFDIFCDNEI